MLLYQLFPERIGTALTSSQKSVISSDFQLRDFKVSFPADLIQSAELFDRKNAHCFETMYPRNGGLDAQRGSQLATDHGFPIKSPKS